MPAARAERDRIVPDRVTSHVSGATDLSMVGRNTTDAGVHAVATRGHEGWEDACATGLENLLCAGPRMRAASRGQHDTNCFQAPLHALRIGRHCPLSRLARSTVLSPRVVATQAVLPIGVRAGV